MAGWMSNGTKGVKSQWVTIVVDRDELDRRRYWPSEKFYLRDVVDECNGRIYGE